MSQIKITDLTFSYESAYENIFEHSSFQIDTNWKLGFIGRNGRGKTTFLNLLLGKYEYKGTISSSVDFDYFPYVIKNIKQNTLVCMKEIAGGLEEWEEYRILIELERLKVKEEVLYRPFDTLSKGEQTKIMLGALFLKNNHFLLIDEPTNHLDMEGRDLLANYLNSKNSFILVSHDRTFLDKCIDHVLSINKKDISVEKGNFTSWQMNKDRQDQFELNRNEKLKKDISHLMTAAERTSNWSNKVEDTKIGSHSADRGRVGHLAAKMMKRSKAIEKRQSNAIEEKKQLLKNLEETCNLKMNILTGHQERYLELEDLGISYGDKEVFKHLNMTVFRGDRVIINGGNGRGKTSLIKVILGEQAGYTGKIHLASGLKISYINQDTSHLAGSLRDYIRRNNLDETLFMTVLRQLDFPRTQLEKSIDYYSAGQRKKLLLAKSLIEPAHLFLWDEPLNYIDVLSRIQIEDLILAYKPTMLFVEHDRTFAKKIATKELN